MTFVLATIVILFGIAVFSFTVSNILLVIFFAIPLTNKLTNKSLLKSNNIIRKYIITLFVQLLILLIVTFVFYVYFRDSAFISLLIGYAFGFMGIIARINSFKFNIHNFSDYFEINRRYFWEELIAKFDEDKGRFTEFIEAAIKQ